MKVEAERIEKAYNQFKDCLNQREQDVITRFYGFPPNVRNSLAEIGERYGVTRERIRQIKAIALKKLKIIKKG